VDSDESQDQDRHGHEIEQEDNEEKGDEKTDTSNSETRRCVTVSANVGRTWILDRPAWRKAVNDSKAMQCQLEELQRHDRAMKQGRGLYLAPYKYGRGLYLGPYKHGQGVAAKKKK